MCFKTIFSRFKLIQSIESADIKRDKEIYIKDSDTHIEMKIFFIPFFELPIH